MSADQKATNITWHPSRVGGAERSRITRARGTVIWLTGLSGCGKSTLATALEHALVTSGHAAYVLDGDNVRHGLNRNLGFSAEDRTENIRRIGEVAKLFADADLITIASFISPYRTDRAAVRRLLAAAEAADNGAFVEVFVDAPLAVCEERDPKGLYKKARAALAEGKGLKFTGIDDPYEPPEEPEVHVRTDQQSVAEGVAAILEHLWATGRILH